LIKDFFDRCHYQSFIKNFVKENFDSDNGPLEKALINFLVGWNVKLCPAVVSIFDFQLIQKSHTTCTCI
jgi:hypothetical protein